MTTAVRAVVRPFAQQSCVPPRKGDLTCEKVGTQNRVPRTGKAGAVAPCVPLRTGLAYQPFIPLTLRNLDQEEDWYAGTPIWDSRARGCDAVGTACEDR
jgi:hypothetical protein